MSDTLRIGSAAELRAALTDPDLATRLGVLQAVAADPIKAASYDGELLAQLASPAPECMAPGERLWRLAAMLALDAVHELTRTVCRWTLSHSREPAEVALARQGLELQPVESLRAFLLTELEGVNATVAADLLVRDPELAPEDRLRVALRATSQVETPAVAASVWVQALAGPDSWNALQRLEALPVAHEVFPQLDGATLRRLLPQVRNAALIRCVFARTPGLAMARLLALGEPVEASLCETDPDLMVQYLQAGGQVADPWNSLATTNHPDLRLEYLRKLDPGCPRQGEFLMECLGSTDWAVRAAAREAWANSSECERVLAWLDGPLRDEAVQVLLLARREALLASHFHLTVPIEEDPKLLCIDPAMIQGVEAPSWQGRPSA